MAQAFQTTVQDIQGLEFGDPLLQDFLQEFSPPQDSLKALQQKLERDRQRRQAEPIKTSFKIYGRKL